MDYLAIRDSDCKNVYYFKTKGEKGRILSKFPNASNRVFLENEMEMAMNWAGVDRIATEEENLWAITKQPKVVENKEVNNVDNIRMKDKDISSTKNEEIKIEQQIETNNIVIEKTKEQDEEKDTNVVKHIMSDFEKIIEIYKKNGIKLLEITLVNGEKYCLITDDLYYVSNFGNLPIDVPFSSLNEKDLKELVFSIIDEKKANGEKNISFNTLLSLDMFEKINKTKYLAFGDLVYASDLNFIEQVRVDKNDIHYCLKDDLTKKHITFNTSSILNMKPYDIKSFNYIVREKEFSTYVKKALKQLEKQKLKELENLKQN